MACGLLFGLLAGRSVGASSLIAAATCTPPTSQADSQLAVLQVVDASGNPLSCIPVLVQVIPRAPNWGRRAWPVVGSGFTDQNGNVQAVVAVPSNNPALISPDGVVNYDVYLVSSSGTPVPMQILAAYYGTDQNRISEFNAEASQYSVITVTTTLQQYFPGGDPSTSIGDGPARVPAFSGRAIARPLLRHQVRVATPLFEPASNPTAGCKWLPLHVVNAKTVVGELHTASWVDTATFTYGQDADTFVEAAYSYDGGATFNDIRGAPNISNTEPTAVSITENATDFAQQIKAMFQYQREQCSYNHRFQRIRATFWANDKLYMGDDASGSDGQSGQPYSLALPAGQTYTRDTNAANFYQPGVNVFKIPLGTQSGFSSLVNISWTAGAVGGCLYGDDDIPDNAHIIYVGPLPCGI
jgi:hypothetical protein